MTGRLFDNGDPFDRGGVMIGFVRRHLLALVLGVVVLLVVVPVVMLAMAGVTTP